MESINIFSTIVAGFLATLVLQVFLFLFGLLTRTKLQLFTLLGTLAIKETDKNKVLSSDRKVLWTGIMIYYGFGMFFAFLYVVLWFIGIGKPRIADVFVFGFLTGIITLLGLSFLLNSQPIRLKVRLTNYFSPLLIGNVIYAINFLFFYVLINNACIRLK